jgi:quercetin dioxygenase-like cupin family protein
MITAWKADAIQAVCPVDEVSILRHASGFTWQDVPIRKYKEEGTAFKDITRQVLFEGHPELPSMLRYFEIAPYGYSTLERHEHVHVVTIVRGEGEALLGSEVQRLANLDVVCIPPGAWHQFRATAGVHFGFLCMVAVERDRPELPSARHLEQLRQDPRIAAFIRT